MVLKLDLALAVLVIAAGVLWLEHGHRVVIEPPTAAELGWRQASAACPTTDNMPYGAECLAYLKGASDSSQRPQIDVGEDNAPTVLSYIPSLIERGSLAAATPCPDSDAVPYSASCVEFLSGWLWRANTPDGPPAGTLAP